MIRTSFACKFNARIDRVYRMCSMSEFVGWLEKFACMHARARQPRRSLTLNLQRSALRQSRCTNLRYSPPDCVSMLIGTRPCLVQGLFACGPPPNARPRTPSREKAQVCDTRHKAGMHSICFTFPPLVENGQRLRLSCTPKAVVRRPTCGRVAPPQPKIKATEPVLRVQRLKKHLLTPAK